MSPSMPLSSSQCDVATPSFVVYANMGCSFQNLTEVWLLMLLLWRVSLCCTCCFKFCRCFTRRFGETKINQVSREYAEPVCSKLHACIHVISIPKEGYANLATHAHRRGWKLFKLRPKTHMLVHVSLDLQKGDLGLNPLSASCWQDEDMIGRVSRLSRTVHPVTASLRTIQKALGCYKTILRPRR